MKIRALIFLWDLSIDCQTGKIPLKLIEVQSGEYVGEDDIKRFEDNYGRVGNS